jgi:hypothetical protein
MAAVILQTLCAVPAHLYPSACSAATKRATNFSDMSSIGPIASEGINAKLALHGGKQPFNLGNPLRGGG